MIKVFLFPPLIFKKQYVAKFIFVCLFLGFISRKYKTLPSLPELNSGKKDCSWYILLYFIYLFINVFIYFLLFAFRFLFRFVCIFRCFFSCWNFPALKWEDRRWLFDSVILVTCFESQNTISYRALKIFTFWCMCYKKRNYVRK